MGLTSPSRSVLKRCQIEKQMSTEMSFTHRQRSPKAVEEKYQPKPIGADSTAARLTKIITKANFRHEGKGADSAAVSGAAIRITNFRTNTTVDTMSNETGAYQVLFLLPSDYKVSVEQPGFNTVERAR